MKTMIGFVFVLLAALAAQADTLQDKVDALNAKTGVVLEAWVEKAPVSMGRAGTLYAGRIAWVQISGALVEQKGAEVIVRNLGLIENNVNVEEAFWVGDIPAPLKEPVDDTPAVGTDKAILEAIGGTIVKAEIQRSAAVGDTLPSATVTGVREVDGKTVEFKSVVYLKGDTLVSSEPTTKAASAATAEAVGPQARVLSKIWEKQADGRYWDGTNWHTPIEGSDLLWSSTLIGSIGTTVLAHD